MDRDQGKARESPVRSTTHAARMILSLFTFCMRTCGRSVRAGGARPRRPGRSHGPTGACGARRAHVTARRRCQPPVRATLWGVCDARGVVRGGQEKLLESCSCRWMMTRAYAGTEIDPGSGRCKATCMVVLFSPLRVYFSNILMCSFIITRCQSTHTESASYFNLWDYKKRFHRVSIG